MNENVSLPPTLKDHGELDHVAIAVRELDGVTAALATFGLTPVGPDEHVSNQGVTVRVLSGGPVLVELIRPEGEGAVARFLEKRGPGLHHIALKVADIEAEHARLQAAGVPLLSAAPVPGRAGSKVVFVHPSYAGGVLIELVEHP